MHVEEFYWGYFTLPRSDQACGLLLLTKVKRQMKKVKLNLINCVRIFWVEQPGNFHSHSDFRRNSLMSVFLVGKTSQENCTLERERRDTCSCVRSTNLMMRVDEIDVVQVILNQPAEMNACVILNDTKDNSFWQLLQHLFWQTPQSLLIG